MDGGEGRAQGGVRQPSSPPAARDRRSARRPARPGGNRTARCTAPARMCIVPHQQRHELGWTDHHTRAVTVGARLALGDMPVSCPACFEGRETPAHWMIIEPPHWIPLQSSCDVWAHGRPAAAGACRATKSLRGCDWRLTP